MKLRISILLLSSAALVLPAFLQGQAQAPPAPPPRMSAKSAAPEDITGNWVSVVTEDWRWRMLTPAKGDFTSIPLNPEGRRVTEAWDPAKDEAAGNQCKAYGAPGLMRLPTRLRISWQDDNTLKIETDEGTQTRLFHFADQAAPTMAPSLEITTPGAKTATAPAKGTAGMAPSLQGYSVAEWDISRPSMMGFALPPPSGKLPGSLKVVTTNLRPGYLRKNGVPYGGDTVLTEYFTRTNEPNGDSWLLLTSIVEDPQYLASDFLTSDHFKREPDGSKWNPNACQAR
jgi:hypothetical protein